MIDLVWTGADGAVYHGQLAPNGEFGPARSLGISSVAQPDVVTYKDNVWMAVRGTDNAIYVKRLYANPDSARFNDEPFVKLPCDARGYPFFKKGDNDLHIATFMATGKAHIRRLMSADKGTWTENWEDADIATID